MDNSVLLMVTTIPHNSCRVGSDSGHTKGYFSTWVTHKYVEITLHSQLNRIKQLPVEVALSICTRGLDSHMTAISAAYNLNKCCRASETLKASTRWKLIGRWEADDPVFNIHFVVSDPVLCHSLWNVRC